jgi:hypothetical protein
MDSRGIFSRLRLHFSRDLDVKIPTMYALRVRAAEPWGLKRSMYLLSR